MKLYILQYKRNKEEKSIQFAQRGFGERGRAGVSSDGDRQSGGAGL